MCSVLQSTLECGVLICDMESIIASNKKSLVGKNLNENVIHNFRNRKNCIFQKGMSMMMSLFDGDTNIYTSQAVSPIICDGDVVGGIIIYTINEVELSLNDLKVCQVVSSILGEI